MNELGYFEHPEQYSDVGDDCFLADSVQARKFFRQNCSPNGYVFLVTLLYASLKEALLPVWAWVDLKTATVMKSVPVFKLKNPDFYTDAQVLEWTFTEDTFYFSWNDKLYLAIFTSDAEIAVRRVRAILSSENRLNVARLEGYDNIDACDPVKVYDQNDGHFVAVCWSLKIGKSYWYDTVCNDDRASFDQVEARDILSYPINIGEKVIIGNNFFECSFNRAGGIVFNETHIIATEKDRRNEDIPLPKKTEPFRPQLKVFVPEKKAPKEKHHPKFIALNSKK